MVSKAAQSPSKRGALLRAGLCFRPCVALVLAVVFAITGTAKLFSTGPFLKALQSTGLIPTSVMPLMIGLPWFELVLAGLLLAPRSRQAGLLICCTFLGGSCTFDALRLIGGNIKDCGCLPWLASLPPMAYLVVAPILEVGAILAALQRDLPIR